MSLPKALCPRCGRAIYYGVDPSGFRIALEPLEFLGPLYEVTTDFDGNDVRIQRCDELGLGIDHASVCQQSTILRRSSRSG